MKKIIFLICFIILNNIAEAQDQNNAQLSDQQILTIIQNSRPSKGSIVPKDIRNRLGATHMDGQYCFTKEPFIIEGARKMNELGYGILKLWFTKANGNQGGYKFNSDWKLTKSMSLKELAEHPYYKEVFDMPFKVFALNINDGFGGASAEDQTVTLNRIENEFYELTKYLIKENNIKDPIKLKHIKKEKWYLY